MGIIPVVIAIGLESSQTDANVRDNSFFILGVGTITVVRGIGLESSQTDANVQ